MLEFQHQTEGASKVRLAEWTATPLGASDTCETQRGSQNAKFPRGEGIAPFVKDSEKSAELWSAAPAEHLPRSPAGTVVPASPAVRPCPGAALTQAQSRRAPVLTRMLRRTAELPAGGGCSDGGGSFRFASTPVAAPRPGTASSGRSASFAAAARLSQDHGVAQGPGGPGSPGG